MRALVPCHWKVAKLLVLPWEFMGTGVDVIGK